MVIFPNAKINLGLNITACRSDGYHDIETIFYPIDLKDVLEIVPAKGEESTLTTSGRPIDCPAEKNLVMKAYRLMEKEYNLPSVDIYLRKNIPDGAGLGGGSSDAASTIIVLNDIFELGLTQAQMAKHAAKLGADCAFFIYNRPMMATGIGEILSGVSVDLKGKHLLLVKPDIYVSTAEAYSRVVTKPSLHSLCELISQPISLWHSTIINDFEKSVFALHPALGQLKKQMYDNSAIYAAMSGSGSSIFGVFEDAILAENVKNKISEKDIYLIAL